MVDGQLASDDTRRNGVRDQEKVERSVERDGKSCIKKGKCCGVKVVMRPDSRVIGSIRLSRALGRM